MRFRLLSGLTLAVALASFTSCSGGSGNAVVSPTCSDPSSFCLTSCNLGCSSDGCAVTDIAQNQPLVFDFSQDVDPRSANFTTISLKTPTGEEPVGTFFTEGARVTFIPEVRSVQGQTFYGFRPGSSLILTLLGGPEAQAALVSTSGDRLSESITCHLRVTGGIVDLDGQPPRARVITPATFTDVPRNTNIVLEFSELIDFAPFFENGSGPDAPIRYIVKRARENRDGVLECNPSAGFPLSGSPTLENDAVRGVTTVSFQPRGQLPGNACLEAEVTSRVRDLAGTRAVPQLFQFVLEAGDVSESSIDETFANDLGMDQARSGGTWANGDGVFAQLGGDGRHGDFDITDGVDQGGGEWIWNTDSQVIGRKQTGWLNDSDTVTDGSFYFTNFVLEAEQTLRFVGSKPARIFVRGTIAVDGTIIASAERVPSDHDGKVEGGPSAGQAGGLGGPAGGQGGDGAFGCDGSGNPNQSRYNNFNGFDGDDVQVPAGHAYADRAIGTGGDGSALFPAHGSTASLAFRWFTMTYEGSTAAGGGGGGFITAGEGGRVFEGGSTGADTERNNDPSEFGPPTDGGIVFDLLPQPAGRSSLDHFLIGGSGGGGGGSHPVLSQRRDTVNWWSGGAGAGGGGAVAIRGGRGMTFGELSRVEVLGGSGNSTATLFSLASWGAPCPGGGGSGGSLLLQVDGDVQFDGLLDVRGGAGIPLVLDGFYRVQTFGGAGSPGYVRLEVPEANPPIDLIGDTQPPAPSSSVAVAQLAPAETDQFAGFMSTWGRAESVFPPEWVRYVVEATVDGQPATFSDDPAYGTPAISGSAALNFYVEGANVDPNTGLPVDGSTRTPWRRYVGPFGPPGEESLANDSQPGMRWLLILDRSMATTVVVHKVSVVFRA